MHKPESQSLPVSPGVYLYKDNTGRIIYVGKARNIRKRVLSYFRQEGELSPKTRAMLAQAQNLETISTATEKEALLLESSLIKKHRPRYNIVLRDDKQYVLFRISLVHKYPRLEMVRQSRRDHARYFGPFTSTLAARETWKTLHRAFPLRRCTDRALQNRVRPCLYYYIRQCLAPCTQEIDEKNYDSLVQNVILFLSGKSVSLLEDLRKQMLDASEALEFEKAAALRDQVQALSRTVEQQSVVLPMPYDLDVIGIVPVRLKDEHLGLALGLLFVREGRLIDRRNFFWSGLGLEEASELLHSFLSQFYSAQSFIPTRIIIPWSIDEEELEDQQALLSGLAGHQVFLSQSRNLAERKLIEMAEANAKEAALRQDRQNPEQIAKRLGEFLDVEQIERIECVDVSHISGQATRVGMVVFELGKPVHSDWRSYDIDTGGDDVKALALWAKRRLADGQPWPDLWLIDGGHGQINGVREILKDLPVKIAGIVKARNQQGQADRRAGNVGDHIVVPGRMNPLNLHSGSPELMYLQFVRDHAHNYALNKHRKARGKQTLSSDLQRLPGVGPKTTQLLWSKFKSLDEIIAASPNDLASIPGIGLKKGQALAERLKKLRG